MGAELNPRTEFSKNGNEFAAINPIPLLKKFNKTRDGHFSELRAKTLTIKLPFEGEENTTELSLSL